MTLPLYHHNGTQLHFQSEVVAQRNHEGEQQLALAATAFYPEGGGQSGDAGVLRWPGGEVRVLDTRKDKATGTIWHRVEGQWPPAGTRVAGEVDAARRWRHMQRHSGEHLLAQAFARINPAFQVAAVGMTSPECHLDLLGHPAEADVRAAETLLRETLGRTDLMLETPTVPEGDLPAYPLRRGTKVRGQVRLVIFKDAAGEFFDVSACGGTHVPRAALCAPVVVLRTERIKGDLTRVTFMAGEEASAYLGEVYRQSRILAQGLSASVDKLPERIAALETERDRLKQDTERLRDELAEELLIHDIPWMLRGVQPVHLLTVNEEALLMPVLRQVQRGTVLVAVTASGRCGIASAVPAFAAGDILRGALAVTGGKGGGRPALAQGTTEQAQEFLAAVRGVLQNT